MKDISTPTQRVAVKEYTDVGARANQKNEILDINARYERDIF
jgi:hypothetical protein